MIKSYIGYMLAGEYVLAANMLNAYILICGHDACAEELRQNTVRLTDGTETNWLIIQPSQIKFLQNESYFLKNAA